MMARVFNCFWQKHPALLLGLTLLLATAAALEPNLIYFLILTLLLYPGLKDWKKTTFVLSAFLLALTSASYRTSSHELPSPKIQGEATFEISTLKNYQSPFHRSLAYKGKLLNFTSDTGETYSDIPCQIYHPFSSRRPIASCDYRLVGTLEQKGPGHFVFKPQKNKPWTPIANTTSIAEMRYKAKQAVLTYLKKQIHHTPSATFLNALATGDVDERTLSLEFGRLGLQHILAISGFHFALITLFLGLFLQLFFSPKISALLLICLLTSYYVFLGDSPSVQRSWIAICTFLIGRVAGLRITALNALGVGLCCEVLLTPTIITHLGFILSFLCTFAILLLYPLLRDLCERLLPTRPFSDIKKMPALDQHGYIFSSIIRQSLAVNLAVHIVSIPVILFLFHRFPLLSLIYNFFFPFWVSLSLLLLCASFLLAYPLPFLSHFFHSVNESWTSFALTLTTHPPALLDFVIRVKTLPYEGVLLFLTAVFMIAIYLTETKDVPMSFNWKYFLKRIMRVCATYANRA